MELWNAVACPYCMRVRAALAEKGIPYRSREVDLANRPPELLEVNPRGGVPVLVDGETTVADSLAILEHLDERWPEPPLFPPALDRQAVRDATERVNRAFGPHMMKLARGSQEERTEALAAVRRALSALDAEVPPNGFLLGTFSAADLALASFVTKLPREWRAAQLGFDRLDAWERVVMSRPAVRDQMAPRAVG
jgi:glutathione S-transferase